MSGSQVAYHLRVNKYIDRQLFVEALDRVGRFRKLTEYGYISMAGTYLEDCRVVHEAHRITRMCAFDSESSVVERQRINRPYGFIRCQRMRSGEMIDNLDDIRLEFGREDTSVIVWLDYASPKHRRTQLQEVQRLMPKLHQGDVVRVTLNADRKTLAEYAEYKALDESVKPPTLAEHRMVKLREKLGVYLPPDRDSAEFLEDADSFVQTLIHAARYAVIEGLESQRRLRAFPLLSTSYSDGHHLMMTIMVLLIREDERPSFMDRACWSDWQYDPGGKWDNFVEIRVPHLSLRERYVLNERLANGGVFDTGTQLFISEEEFAQYTTHYLRYPTFAPLVLR